MDCSFVISNTFQALPAVELSSTNAIGAFNFCLLCKVQFCKPLGIVYQDRWHLRSS
uniref:Uncharacterized protein n=1 Tax=Arundo donax TaxID=35708 RepID=A0A0A9HDS8_ARUDO